MRVRFSLPIILSSYLYLVCWTNFCRDDASKSNWPSFCMDDASRSN